MAECCFSSGLNSKTGGKLKLKNRLIRIMSRPTPGGRLGGLAGGRGCLGPDLGVLGGLARWGGCPGPHPGGPEPHLGGPGPYPGGPGPGLGGFIPACTEADTSPSKQLLLRAVHILLECIHVMNVTNSIYCFQHTLQSVVIDLIFPHWQPFALKVIFTIHLKFLYKCSQ